MSPYIAVQRKKHMGWGGRNEEESDTLLYTAVSRFEPMSPFNYVLRWPRCPRENGFPGNPRSCFLRNHLQLKIGEALDGHLSTSQQI